MAVYWALLIACAAAGIPMCGLYKKREGRLPGVFCLIMGIALTVTAALRFDVGTDYNMYAALFYNMNFMDTEQLGLLQREKGMLLPVVLTELFTFDYFPAFVVLSVIIYAVIMSYCAGCRESPWIGIFAFLCFGVYFNSLNFMRQILAAAVGAYALEYFRKGNYLRFAAFVIIAGAFHRSAFMLLPFGLVCLIPMNVPVLVTAAALGAVSYTFSGEIIGKATQIIYKNYVTTDPEMSVGLPGLYTVMFGAVFAAAFGLRKRMQGDVREINILLWCSFGAFYAELLGTKHAIISRIGLLFFLPVVFRLAPKIFAAVCRLSKRKKHSRRSAAIAAAVMIAAMSGVYGGLLAKNYNGVVPYRTVFEREVTGG